MHSTTDSLHKEVRFRRVGRFALAVSSEVVQVLGQKDRQLDVVFLAHGHALHSMPGTRPFAPRPRLSAVLCCLPESTASQGYAANLAFSSAVPTKKPLKRTSGPFPAYPAKVAPSMVMASIGKGGLEQML